MTAVLKMSDMILKLVLLHVFLISACYGQQTNRPPIFSPSPSSFAVNENEIHEVLTTLHATDPDGDPIEFSIDINDYFDIAAVNATSVIVRSTRGIDYEQNSNLEFTVTATDTISNSRTPKQISVIVKDLNDNAPVFSQGGSSSFVVAEDVSVDYKIADAFVVTDEDTGLNAQTEISCYVDSITPESKIACETFEVVPRRVGNGHYVTDIKLKKLLDFEERRSYIMTVKATNIAPPANFTTKNFVINVLDSQDQSPVFIKAPYSPIPDEELPVGTVIDVISVRDGDKEVQPPRNLQLKLLNDSLNWLSLTPLKNQSGVFTSNLTIKNRIDRELYHNRPVYTVAIEVSELLANGQPDSSAVSTSHINVQIFDINDNAPEFYTGSDYEMRVVEPLVLNVVEGLGVNTNLPGFLLSIIDIDLPPNNAFDVGMSGFGSDTFQLAPTFGTGSAVLSLSVKKEANIDYEKEMYRQLSLTITATDRAGDERLTRNATIEINLIDKNDNFPHFDEGVYAVRVSPQTPLDSPIITVNATDRDSGSYGSVTYSIIQTSNLVRIDKDSGTVYLTSHPRDDMDATYQVELIVTDGGGKSTTSQLVLSFTNEFPQRPTFDSHIYNATVYENRANFNNEPVIVTATDPDSRSIVFTIMAGNTEDDAFQLHPTNGQLTLRRALSKQDGRQFDLTIMVSDGGLNDTAHVYIDLLDYNDYKPKFLRNNYAKIIPETTAVGEVILEITATDDDGADEDGGIVIYSILSGDESRKFALNPNTGELSVKAELNYDVQNMFILQIKAEDRGVPRRSATTFVNITLSDVNNRLPQFSNQLYIQYMNEDDPVGSKVLQVNAYDLDEDSELRFSIDSSSYEAKDSFNRPVTSTSDYNFKNGFSINEKSGEIVTRLPFNREVVAFISFHIVVVDINSDSSELQESSARVEVNIRQVGVGVPLFLNEPWTAGDQRIRVTVAEGQVGLIVSLIAVDSVSGAKVTRFTEITGDPDNLFTVRLNGEVHLNHALDYEQLVSKTKRIIVDAMTSTGQVSSATLEISVTNVNDNPPVFSEQMYTFSVTEGTFVTNQRVGSVFATDRDEGTELVYQLVGRYNNLFYINNQGSIFVKENVVIDAEVTRKYEVQVEVSDSSSQTGYKASVPVVIHVDTANEFYPVCAEDVFTFFVPKAIVVGRGFGQVVATDEDVGDSVQYFISNGAAEFAVDQQTGVISAAQSLTQREQSKYSLTVVARDSTAPYREVVCPVNILVISSQQSNLPIFVQPPNEGYTYTIPEGSDFHSTVLQVEVRSADNKILEGITYSLANTTDIFYFDIDERTGRIYVVNDIDRELKDTYQLIVVARTNTTELSRYFQIILSDVDDNDPKFSNCDLMYPVRLEVEEGESGSQEVIGAVRACDEDEGVNGKIYYHVVECEDGTTTKQSGRFSINIETGEISVDPGTLDYETSTTHTICVNASTSRINANVRSDQWKVVIVVKNKDDFKLEFTRTQISVVVGGNVGSGQEIVQIKANGQDVASLNSVTYEILSITYFKGLEIVEGSNNVTIESAFVINRFTGKVTTTLPSYLKMIGARFEIKIRAKTSSDSADLTLTVYINNPTQQLILVIDQSPDEVQTFIEEFFRELEEIHEGYTFHLQRLSFHEDPYTQQSYQNKTDVYMYVLDKDDNLVDASTVSSILYSTYSETQAELYRKYGVTFSGPTAESLVSATRVWLDWYNYEWIWWLIIASSIVLFIDAVVLIICLLYLYNKYVKKPSRYVPNIVKLK